MEFLFCHLDEMIHPRGFLTYALVNDIERKKEWTKYHFVLSKVSPSYHMYQIFRETLSISGVLQKGEGILHQV